MSSVSVSSDGAKMIAASNYADTDYTWGGSVYTSANYGTTWNEESSLGHGAWIGAQISADGSKMAVTMSSGPSYLGSFDGVLSDVSSALSSQNITTNLDSLTDQSQACGLYFEKPGVGKVEFSTCPDLTDPTVISWIENFTLFWRSRTVLLEWMLTWSKILSRQKQY